MRQRTITGPRRGILSRKIEKVKPDSTQNVWAVGRVSDIWSHTVSWTAALGEGPKEENSRVSFINSRHRLSLRDSFLFSWCTNDRNHMTNGEKLVDIQEELHWDNRHLTKVCIQAYSALGPHCTFSVSEERNHQRRTQRNIRMKAQWRLLFPRTGIMVSELTHWRNT